MIRECELIKGFDWYRDSRFCHVSPDLFGGVALDNEWETGRLRQVNIDNKNGRWWHWCYGVGYNYYTDTVIEFCERTEFEITPGTDYEKKDNAVPCFHPVSMIGVPNPIEAIVALVYVFVNDIGEKTYYVYHFHEKDDSDVLEGYLSFSPSMLAKHLQVDIIKEDEVDSYVKRAYKGNPFKYRGCSECRTVEVFTENIVRDAVRAREEREGKKPDNIPSNDMGDLQVFFDAIDLLASNKDKKPNDVEQTPCTSDTADMRQTPCTSDTNSSLQCILEAAMRITDK